MSRGSKINNCIGHFNVWGYIHVTFIFEIDDFDYVSL